MKIPPFLLVGALGCLLSGSVRAATPAVKPSPGRDDAVATGDAESRELATKQKDPKAPKSPPPRSRHKPGNGNNGVGNGPDPQPPGNPPPNDDPGTPGNPGNKGGAKK